MKPSEKAEQYFCIAGSRCPHRQYCLDQHICKYGQRVVTKTPRPQELKSKGGKNAV